MKTIIPSKKDHKLQLRSPGNSYCKVSHAVCQHLLKQKRIPKQKKCQEFEAHSFAEDQKVREFHLFRDQQDLLPPASHLTYCDRGIIGHRIGFQTRWGQKQPGPRPRSPESGWTDGPSTERSKAWSISFFKTDGFWSIFCYFFSWNWFLICCLIPIPTFSSLRWSFKPWLFDLTRFFLTSQELEVLQPESLPACFVWICTSQLGPLFDLRKMDIFYYIFLYVNLPVVAHEVLEVSMFWSHGLLKRKVTIQQSLCLLGDLHLCLFSQFFDLFAIYLCLSIWLTDYLTDYLTDSLKKKKQLNMNCEANQLPSIQCAARLFITVVLVMMFSCSWSCFMSPSLICCRKAFNWKPSKCLGEHLQSQRLKINWNVFFFSSDWLWVKFLSHRILGLRTVQATTSTHVATGSWAPHARHCKPPGQLPDARQKDFPALPFLLEPATRFEQILGLPKPEFRMSKPRKI